MKPIAWPAAGLLLHVRGWDCIELYVEGQGPLFELFRWDGRGLSQATFDTRDGRRLTTWGPVKLRDIPRLVRVSLRFALRSELSYLAELFGP